jgi:hypothetical protein
MANGGRLPICLTATCRRHNNSREAEPRETEINDILPLKDWKFSRKDAKAQRKEGFGIVDETSDLREERCFGAQQFAQDLREEIIGRLPLWLVKFLFALNLGVFA